MPRKPVTLTEQVSELYVYYQGKRVTLPADLWIMPKLCHCKHWGYPEFQALIKAEGRMEEPPACTKCGKYQNRMQKCPRCEQFFYLWFKHSRQGWHKTPLEGHFCWNCLEKSYPPVVEPHAIKRFGFRPPPDEVLPPGYELYIRERISTSGSDRTAT